MRDETPLFVLLWFDVEVVAEGGWEYSDWSSGEGNSTEGVGGTDGLFVEEEESPPEEAMRSSGTW